MKSFYIWKFNPFLCLIQAKHFCWAPDQAKKISIQVCQEGELPLRTLNYFSKLNQVHFCMSLSVHKIHVCFASVKQYLEILCFFFFVVLLGFFYTGNIKWQHLINLTGTNVMTSLICNIQAKAFILEFGISWCTTYHSHYSNKIQTTIIPLGELPGKNDNFHLTGNKNFWARLEQHCWKPPRTFTQRQTGEGAAASPQRPAASELQRQASDTASRSPLAPKHFSLSSSGSSWRKTPTTISQQKKIPAGSIALSFRAESGKRH